MVPGRVDPTVHEFLPRDRVERLGGGSATAAAGPPDGRENSAAGHESRASGRRASSPPIRVEDRDTADRWTGPVRPWPRPRRRGPPTPRRRRAGRCLDGGRVHGSHRAAALLRPWWASQWSGMGGAGGDARGRPSERPSHDRVSNRGRVARG